MPPTAVPSRHAGALVSVSMEVIEKVAQKDTGSLPGPGSRGASERRAKSALCVGALQEELCDIDDDIRERREPNNAFLVNC